MLTDVFVLYSLCQKEQEGSRHFNGKTRWEAGTVVLPYWWWLPPSPSPSSAEKGLYSNISHIQSKLTKTVTDIWNKERYSYHHSIHHCLCHHHDHCLYHWCYNAAVTCITVSTNADATACTTATTTAASITISITTTACVITIITTSSTILATICAITASTSAPHNCSNHHFLHQRCCWFAFISNISYTFSS